VARAISISQGSISPLRARSTRTSAGSPSTNSTSFSIISAPLAAQPVAMPVTVVMLFSCMVTPRVYLDCSIMGFLSDTTMN